MQAMQNGSASAHGMQQHAEQEDSAAFWRAWLSANLKGSQLDEPQPQRPLETTQAAGDDPAALTNHSRCALLLLDAAAAVDDWVTYDVLAAAHCFDDAPHPKQFQRQAQQYPPRKDCSTAKYIPNDKLLSRRATGQPYPCIRPAQLLEIQTFSFLQTF
jgi:hypothetical protein